MKTTIKFKVHTPALLREIADSGLDRKMGVLKLPLNMFRSYLVRVAERASIINDPILNELMCDMALYGVADPEDPEYNREILEHVYTSARHQREAENSNKL